MPDSFPTLAPDWVARPLVCPANVTDYIPQRAPFVLIDTLYQCQPGQAWAGLRVPPDHLLVQQGYLSEAGIIESMAQAVALKSGYEACQQASGAPPRVGFIAVLKAVQVHALPPVGCTLVTQVEVVLQGLDVLVVKTRCGYHTTPVAQCEMRLFLEAAVPPSSGGALEVAVSSHYA
jgi:predicted hotdog family 3-hydroxylacyl-ACP dehydratase